jgi:hypothetical protein
LGQNRSLEVLLDGIHQSFMKKLLFHFAIGFCAFAIGISFSFLSQKPVTTPMSIDKVFIPVEPVSPEISKTCEIHGVYLKTQSIQHVCGEFKGSFKRGGRSSVQVPCNNYERRQMPLEEAQFFFNLSGGTNTWHWWMDYEAAKKTQFPHGYDWRYEECKLNGMVCQDIEVCTKCRAAQLSWKEDAANQW